MNQPSASGPAPRRLHAVPWQAWIGALVLVALAASIVLVVTRGAVPAISHGPTPPPYTTWPAGARHAPAFSLLDARGRNLSLGALRGRPVLITFIDPVCRNLCPTEARTLMAAERALPASERPAIVAVSVNPWADEKTNFALDVTHWGLGPEWRWGVGSQARLSRVWHAYAIAWAAETKTIAGVTVHEIVHTEATYLVDGAGDERALFIAPFSAKDVVGAVRALH